MPQPKRHNWGLVHTDLPELDLVKLQRDSYEKFLDDGVRQALSDVYGENGIEDYTGKNWRLQFGEYRFGPTKVSIQQAKAKG